MLELQLQAEPRPRRRELAQAAAAAGWRPSRGGERGAALQRVQTGEGHLSRTQCRLGQPSGGLDLDLEKVAVGARASLFVQCSKF